MNGVTLSEQANKVLSDWERYEACDPSPWSFAGHCQADAASLFAADLDKGFMTPDTARFYASTASQWSANVRNTFVHRLADADLRRDTRTDPTHIGEWFDAQVANDPVDAKALLQALVDTVADPQVLGMVALVMKLPAARALLDHVVEEQRPVITQLYRQSADRFALKEVMVGDKATVITEVAGPWGLTPAEIEGQPGLVVASAEPGGIAR